MNYLHIIELLNKMEHKIIHAKLETYTSSYQQKKI